MVFKELQRNQSVVNGKRSEFFIEGIDFLDNIVSKNVVHMEPAKVEAIVNWSNMRTIHGVRKFQGLCSYYQHFSWHLFEFTAPLHNLTRRGVKFQWTVWYKEIFYCLKQKFSSKFMRIPRRLRPSTIGPIYKRFMMSKVFGVYVLIIDVLFSIS